MSDTTKLIRGTAVKKLVLAIVAATFIAPAVSAQTHVNGYVKRDGTYVAPYYRSSPNSTPYDNYSTKGNVNPYTGQAGTRNPYPSTTPSTTYGNPYSTYKAPCYYNCPR